MILRPTVTDVAGLATWLLKHQSEICLAVALYSLPCTNLQC